MITTLYSISDHRNVPTDAVACLKAAEKAVHYLPLVLNPLIQQILNCDDSNTM